MHVAEEGVEDYLEEAAALTARINYHLDEIRKLGAMRSRLIGEALDAGLSQRKVAERIGISQAAISQVRRTRLRHS